MLILFVGAMARRLISPLLLRIAADYAITFDVAASVFITGSIGVISGLLTSGFVSRLITHRWTLVGSGGLGALATFGLALAPTFALFHVAFYFLGVASGFYPGSGLASVQAVASPEHRGKALGLHELGPNLTFIVAPLLVALLGPRIGWRGIMHVVAATALGGTVVFALFGRASRERGEPPHRENLKMCARNRGFWVLTAVLTLVIAAAVGVYSVLPTFLSTVHEMSEARANTIVGAGRILAFLTMVTVGTLMDRFGFTRVALVILIAGGAVTVLVGLTTGTLLYVVVVLQPAIVGAYLPISWAALSDVVPSHARPLSISLAIALSNLIAAGAAPQIMAAAGAAGYFGPAFVVLGSLVIAGSSVLTLLPRKTA